MERDGINSIGLKPILRDALSNDGQASNIPAIPDVLYMMVEEFLAKFLPVLTDVLQVMYMFVLLNVV